MQGQWENNVNNFLKSSKTKDIKDLLKVATTEFTNLPDMDEDLLSPNIGSAISIENEDDAYSIDDSVNEDLIDSAIDTETTLKKEKHEKMIAAVQDKKMNEIKSKVHLEDIVESAKEIGLHTRDISQASNAAEIFIPDPNIKQLYVHFFFDGFTIGNKEDMSEKLELRKMDDPDQIPTINSLKAGYVPREFCGNAKEVDVHMIYKQCTFENRFKQEETNDNPEINQEDEDIEKIMVEGLGEFTQEEIEEQKRMLEEFERQRKETNENKEVSHYSIEPKTIETSIQPNKVTNSEEKSKKLEIVENSGNKLGSSSDNGFIRDFDYIHKINEDEKISTIQLILMDNGQTFREKVQFNSSSTLDSIYQFAAQKFDLNQLQLTFSGKPLKEFEKTIDELKLANASIRVVKI